MDTVETVRAEHDTALDRLGSEKALLAMTEARLETEEVLAAAGGAVASVRATLADWAADSEGERAAALAEAAEALGEDCDRLAEALGADLPGDSPFLVLALDGATDRERAGAGLLGAGLVLDRLLLGCVSFFVNEADGRRADRCRETRETAAGMVEAAGDLDLGEEGAAAAGKVIEAAYAEYAGRLEAMGLDPKPVC